MDKKSLTDAIIAQHIYIKKVNVERNLTWPQYCIMWRDNDEQVTHLAFDCESSAKQWIDSHYHIIADGIDKKVDEALLG